MISARQLMHQKVRLRDGGKCKIDDILFEPMGWKIQFMVLRVPRLLLFSKQVVCSPEFLNCSKEGKELRISANISRDSLLEMPSRRKYPAASDRDPHEGLAVKPSLFATQSAGAKPGSLYGGERELAAGQSPQHTQEKKEHEQPHKTPGLRTVSVFRNYAVRKEDGTALGRIKSVMIDENTWSLSHLILADQHGLQRDTAITDLDQISGISTAAETVYLQREAPAATAKGDSAPASRDARGTARA